MKTKLLIISFIITCISGISQTNIPTGVTVSPLYKFSKSYERSQFVMDDTLYSFKANFKTTFLQKNAGNNYDFQSKQELGKINGSWDLIPKPLISDKKFGFISQSYSSKLLVTEYTEFDLQSHSFLPPVQVSSGYTAISLSNKQNYFVELNDNINRVGSFSGKRKFSHEKVRVNFSVYNSDIEKLWTNSITFPFDDSQYEFNSVKINDAGEVFLFFTVYHTEKRELFDQSGEKTADQVLYYITKDDAVQMAPTFLSNFNKAGSFYFVSDQQGNNYLAGLYQDKEEGSINYQGFFLTQIKNGTFGEVKEYPFDREIADNYLKPDKNGEIKPYRGTANLSIKNIQFGNDGSFTAFFDQSYSYLKCNKDGCVTMYVNQNIFISHAKLNGTGDWLIKIPKNQLGMIDSELGYFENYTPEYSYLLFVDHADNFSLPQDESPKTHQSRRGGIMTVCRIDNKTGELEKKQLFDVNKLNNYRSGIELLDFDRFLNFGSKVMFEAYVKVKKNVLITIDYKKIF